MDQRTAPDGGLGTATGVLGNAEPSLKNGLPPIKCIKCLPGRQCGQSFFNKLGMGEYLLTVKGDLIRIR